MASTITKRTDREGSPPHSAATGPRPTMTDGTLESHVSVLIVDDEDSMRTALTRFLSQKGYKVTPAATAPEALDQLSQNSFVVALLDIRMPGMSGIDLLPEALDLDPDLAVLMLTGVSDATNATLCMRRGAVDYLTKPIELHDLTHAIKRALRRRDTMIQDRGISSWLREEVQCRTQEVIQERQKQEQITIATLEALVKALEAKSKWLSGHSARVAAFAAMVAHNLKLPDDEVESVRTAGRLHDLGMIGIREGVLNKTSQLTKEEFEHVKQHVTVGSQILAPLKHLGPIVRYVRSHHEHWNATGYPDGLKGDSIPLGARIICVAEIYDALTTHRPYQQPLSPEQAVQRLKKLAGQVIDPTVMTAVEAAIKSRKTLVFINEE